MIDLDITYPFWLVLFLCYFSSMCDVWVSVRYGIADFDFDRLLLVLLYEDSQSLAGIRQTCGYIIYR